MSYKIEDKEALETFICQNWDSVNSWIDQHQLQLPQPFTSSVDVRESKIKFAPVDHNMYPAGFNNICGKDLLNCSEVIKTSIKKFKHPVKKIGILPESHTKNKFYLDHLFSLKKTFEMAEYEVLFFSPDEALFEGEKELNLESFSNHQIKIVHAKFKNGVFISTANDQSLDLDLIVLNHDQSSPLNVPWEELKTSIVPTPFAGWFRRQKTHHFQHYKKVANEFCKAFNINPTLIQAEFRAVDNVNFNTKEGMDELANEVDIILKELPSDSNVFVKASQGTYGMGISVVSSGEEIRQMNRKMRNKMDVGKNNLKFTSVLIQESVETIIKYDDAPAEITVYLIDGKSIGGFMRANPLKGTQANLNAQGMIYRKLCISDLKQSLDHQIKEQVYTVIARLSTLAAAREMKDLMENI